MYINSLVTNILEIKLIRQDNKGHKANFHKTYTAYCKFCIYRL